MSRTAVADAGTVPAANTDSSQAALALYTPPPMPQRLGGPVCRRVAATKPGCRRPSVRGHRRR